MGCKGRGHLLFLPLAMPPQLSEELEVVKLAIEKKHGAYHEGVICAEHVQIISKTKMKDRLLVVGCHRLYLFRKAPPQVWLLYKTDQLLWECRL